MFFSSSRRNLLKFTFIIFLVVVILISGQNFKPIEENDETISSNFDVPSGGSSKTLDLLGLDHIYVLTIGTARDHYFRPVLDYLNLKYEVFQGITFEDKRLQQAAADIKQWASVTERKDKIQNVAETELIGRVGCTMGHRMMWQDMIDKGYETAMFFEDDIDVHITMQKVLAQAMAEIPESWDVIYPGYCSHRWMATMNITAPNDGLSWHQMNRASCGHAYILKQETAKLLLNRSEFVDPEMRQTAWDVHMAHLISDGVIQSAYGVTPELVIQRPRSSKNPSLVSPEDSEDSTKQVASAIVPDRVERGWRYRGSFTKNNSAAYQAGVSYWHDLD